MAQDIVRFIRINTGTSEKSINSLKSEIKSLNTELGKLTVGSQRYNEVSKQLTSRQRELREVTRDLQLASKTTEQRFNNLQKFGTGLTAGFTTLANTFALLGSDSENFNKTITKLTGSLAILQSVGGLKDLVSSFPGVISGFKNIGDSIKRFFTGAVNSFDPLERRLTTAANNLKNIGKIDIKADIKTSGTSTQIKPIESPDIEDVNQDLAEQQKQIIPLNEQWEKYNKQLKDLKTVQPKLQKQTQDYTKLAEIQSNTVKELKEQYKLLTELQHLGKPLSPEQYKTWDELPGKIKEAEKALEITNSEIAKTSAVSGAVGKQIDVVGGKISDTEKQMKSLGIATSNVGRVFGQILSTVGWSLLIAIILKGIQTFYNYIKTIKTAAKEQKEFNQELNKTTSELSSSKLAKFYELQKAFEAIGNSAESKKKFIEDYSDQLKETGLAINDVQTAEDAFINNTDKYVQAIIARAKIDAYKEQITKKTQETLEKNLELERKIKSGEYKTSAIAQSQAGVVGQGYISKDDLETQRKVVEQARKKLEDEIKENNKELNDFITNQVGNISKLNKEYSALWATNDKGTKETSKSTSKTVDIPDIQPLLDEISKEIDDFIEAEYDVVLGDREKELRELEEKWFKPYKELYETYGGDINQLTEEYERRRKEIIDKYKPDTKDTQKELESQLTAIKETFDFQSKQLSLYKPKTTYKQLGLTFQYQSGSDVKKEYQNTLDYNNQVYNLTAERIKKENEIYNKQLENSQLTADEKLNIERKLAENTKALQDAELQRDQDNTQAVIDMQRKKLQAFQATAQVTSSVLGSLGSAFDTKAQLAKTEKEQKKAAKTAKGFKAAQAVIDALSAANGAYSSMSSIPYVGPALGAAAAAAALIAGYANVKQILAQDVSGSTIQQATGTPASVNVPAISYTRNLVGDKELEEINKPQVCLVVEDLNNVQNRMQVRESNATF